MSLHSGPVACDRSHLSLGNLKSDIAPLDEGSIRPGQRLLSCTLQAAAVTEIGPVEQQDAEGALPRPDTPSKLCTKIRCLALPTAWSYQSGRQETCV